MLLLTLTINMIFISFVCGGKYYSEKNHSMNYGAKVDYLVLALDKLQKFHLQKRGGLAIF